MVINIFSSASLDLSFLIPGWFVFLLEYFRSRQPVVNQLRVRAELRNWFGTVIRTTIMKKHIRVFCVVFCDYAELRNGVGPACK